MPKVVAHPATPKDAAVKQHKLRFVTAASLFDGHDVSINIMRRILQAKGVEVIHLGHNRSAQEIVAAALQEDVHAIAISSYQGGHVEYFKYVIDLLRENNADDIRVFGGGGGVITQDEINELHDYGVAHIYSPEDGQKLGLHGMIDHMISTADHDLCQQLPKTIDELTAGGQRGLVKTISALQEGVLDKTFRQQIVDQAAAIKNIPILGLTGTGGSGKSSLTDELIQRFRHDNNEVSIALLAIDPSKRKTGGALLGDRIRMNAIEGGNITMHSLATRDAESEVIPAMPDIIAACKLADYDLIIVETPGIGQGDAAIVPFVDVSVYVMTPEFGAASQLEKIDMLDFADYVVINKFDRKGAQDALRDVRKTMQRNQEAFDRKTEDMPVFGTIASKFNDFGVTAFYQSLIAEFNQKQLGQWQTQFPTVVSKVSDVHTAIVPASQQRYLAEIAASVKDYHQRVKQQVTLAREIQSLKISEKILTEKNIKQVELPALIDERQQQLDLDCAKLLKQWPDMQQQYQQDELVFKVRDKEIRTPLYRQSLSGTRIAKVAIPRYEDQGEILKWLMLENVPGHFPYTAGVFPLKREGEDPGRMFAGEGDAFRTNERFKYLSRNSESKRLSTAFDSVTLYGFDPHERPDIYGKVGNSGVSIATLDDMKTLYNGFDLCDPKTSVSMTINGPAPTIMAMFLNTAIDQQVAQFIEKNKREPNEKEYLAIHETALNTVRGTVQADILKEDQGQNTCIFSTEFSLKVMGDIQQYFIEHKVRNFYSVSISGYHIAEAGANPISQLAFTLANGFTYVEAYLARGMKIDDFAPSLSFFFSNGMDPEYSVLGRVARRIWAITMRDKYGANSRSQKLKYHVQTSGRSLHAQEMAFNDIRTTLEALIALYDNCNSLHTNAYDEAITTPTEESVRRAMAIQLIINKEWGLSMNENPNQGSFIIEELTDLVESAVLEEFERINERGGVLGAMETGYQRGKIQDESMYYEMKKHDGSLPLIGVNSFLDDEQEDEPDIVPLTRSTEEEKQRQITRLRDFQQRNEKDCAAMCERLQQAVINNDNVFAVLMDAVRVCSLGQITDALFAVGGKYRRNM